MGLVEENIIDIDDNASILALAIELTSLLEKGYKTVRIETVESGEGTTEDGDYEFIFAKSRLVASY